MTSWQSYFDNLTPYDPPYVDDDKKNSEKEDDDEIHD